MNGQYDKELKEIEFYKIHPEYLPFVGDKYDEFKILQVGESHYIGQTPETEEFSIQYFQEHWWNSKCNDVFQHEHTNDVNWGSWYTTRDVIGRFFENYQNNYSIFSKPLDVFRKVYQPENSSGDREDYHYFAFMNFFQMPSLYSGETFWKSLEISAKKQDNKQLAYEVYKTAAQVSARVLDDVIKVIDPAVVIFTSSSAWKVYQKFGIYADSHDCPLIIQTAHPGCCWWNRKRKKGSSSCEYLKAELEKHIRNK